MSFDDFAVHTLFNNVFMQLRDGERMLEETLSRMPKRALMVDLADKILDLAERQDPAGRRFAAAVGANLARAEMAEAARFKGMPGLPANPLQGGEYWDLAAGPNAFAHMMRSLDPATQYTFIDRSTFVTSYLRSRR